jgi:hypothetical protein
MERSILEVKYDLESRIKYMEDSINTFDLADSHFKVLNDVSKFKKNMEKKVKFATLICRLTHGKRKSSLNSIPYFLEKAHISKLLTLLKI